MGGRWYGGPLPQSSPRARDRPKPSQTVADQRSRTWRSAGSVPKSRSCRHFIRAEEGTRTPDLPLTRRQVLQLQRVLVTGVPEWSPLSPRVSPRVSDRSQSLKPVQTFERHMASEDRSEAAPLAGVSLGPKPGLEPVEPGCRVAVRALHAQSASESPAAAGVGLATTCAGAGRARPGLAGDGAYDTRGRTTNIALEGGAVPERRSEPELDRTVAFRPADSPIADAVLAEHASGFVEETAGDSPPRPGAVPPPAPTRPAPRASFASRMRERLEGG